MFRFAFLFAVLAVAPASAAWGQASCEPVGSSSVQSYPGWEYTLVGGSWQCRNLDTGHTYQQIGRGWVFLKPKECVCKGECECKECPRNCVAETAAAEAPLRCRCDLGFKCKCCLKCKEPCACQTCKCDHCPGKPVGFEAIPKFPSEAANYGMDWHGTDRDRHKLNGSEVSRERALAALVEGGSVPDDSAHLRLTVIGPEADRLKVVNDLTTAPALTLWKDRVVVQSFPPDAWQVSDAGFKRDGKPTIYLQSPAGKVLHRQDDYADGPAGLSKALSNSERKANPQYDPAKDPDLRKDQIGPGPIAPPVGCANHPATCGLFLLACAGAGLGIGLIFGKRKPTEKIA